MTEFNATIVLPFQRQRCTNDNSLEAYHITEALYPLREQHKIELTHSAIDGQKPYIRQYQADFVRNLSMAREVNPELCGIYTRSSLDVCYETFDEFIKGIKRLSFPASAFLAELHPFSGDSEQRILLKMHVRSLIGFKWLEVTPLNTAMSIQQIGETMEQFRPYVLIPLLMSADMEIPIRLRKVMNVIELTRTSSRVPVWVTDCL